LGHFAQGQSIGCDLLRDGLTVNELPFAAAGDESRFAQNFQVMGNGGRWRIPWREDREQAVYS
jgi:hypothetical protein